MRIWLTTLVATTALFVGCTTSAPETPPPPPEEERLPIAISPTADSDFAVGDSVGIYVVNYNNGVADPLVSSGNYVDNICFTCNGSWTPTTPIYWLDDKINADLYGYAPYDESVNDVTNYRFAVAENQSSLSALNSSDLMWGKGTNVSPSAVAVNIEMKHLMSRLVILLKSGNGCTDEELADAKITICSVKNESVVNLSTGEISAVGDPRDIIPYFDNGVYRLLVVPQSVSDVDFIKIELGANTYYIKQNLTLESGKQQKCTITISKSDQGINTGITGWLEDSTDYGGTVG